MVAGSATTRATTTVAARATAAQSPRTPCQRPARAANTRPPSRAWASHSRGATAATATATRSAVSRAAPSNPQAANSARSRQISGACTSARTAATAGQACQRVAAARRGRWASTWAMPGASRPKATALQGWVSRGDQAWLFSASSRDEQVQRAGPEREPAEHRQRRGAGQPGHEARTGASGQHGPPADRHDRGQQQPTHRQHDPASAAPAADRQQQTRRSQTIAQGQQDCGVQRAAGSGRGTARRAGRLRRVQRPPQRRARTRRRRRARRFRQGIADAREFRCVPAVDDPDPAAFVHDRSPWCLVAPRWLGLRPAGGDARGGSCNRRAGARTHDGAPPAGSAPRRRPGGAGPPGSGSAQVACSCLSTCLATHLSVSKTPTPLTAMPSKFS